MDLRLADRGALVTGASTGLGRAIAAALIAEGVRVTICSRDSAAISKTATQLGARGYACDLSRPDDIAGLLSWVEHEHAPVDILVINTGGPPSGNFESCSDEMWSKAFEGLWLSCVRLIRGCLPAMRNRGWGRILVVTSISAREPLDGLLLSNAIRPGLHGLVNSLSREIAAYGITINAVMPGFTLTDRLKLLGFGPEQIMHVPCGRAGLPDEFAALVTFLASDLAGYITGQAIACDGGYVKSI